MNTVRLLLIAGAATAALAGIPGHSLAQGPPLGCTGPGCYGAGPGCGAAGCHPLGYPSYYTFGNFVCGGRGPLPTYQAAPWYLYWPYDGHFLTPAPVTGAFFGPATPSNFPVNPYFPGPNYSYGYVPVPGGPAPQPAPGGPYPPPPPGYPIAPPPPAGLPSALPGNGPLAPQR